MASVPCSLVSRLGLVAPDAVDVAGVEAHAVKCSLHVADRLVVRSSRCRAPDAIRLGTDNELSRLDAVGVVVTAPRRGLADDVAVPIGLSTPDVVGTGTNRTLKSLAVRLRAGRRWRSRSRSRRSDLSQAKLPARDRTDDAIDRDERTTLELLDRGLCSDTEDAVDLELGVRRVLRVENGLQLLDRIALRATLEDRRGRNDRSRDVCRVVDLDRTALEGGLDAGDLAVGTRARASRLLRVAVATAEVATENVLQKPHDGRELLSGRLVDLVVAHEADADALGVVTGGVRGSFQAKKSNRLGERRKIQGSIASLLPRNTPAEATLVAMAFENQKAFSHTNDVRRGPLQSC